MPRKILGIGFGALSRVFPRRAVLPVAELGLSAGELEFARKEILTIDTATMSMSAQALVAVSSAALLTIPAAEMSFGAQALEIGDAPLGMFSSEFASEFAT